MDRVFNIFNQHAYGIKRLFEFSCAAAHSMTRAELMRLLRASGVVPVSYDEAVPVQI